MDKKAFTIVVSESFIYEIIEKYFQLCILRPPYDQMQLVDHQKENDSYTLTFEHIELTDDDYNVLS
jgi:hypothetical protein